MPKIAFTQLPDTARLWVFAAEDALPDAARDRVLATVDALLHDWTAHGRPVVAARDWREDRFLFIGVDEAATQLSGCSIDGMVRTLKQLGGELGIELVDSPPVWYRRGETITTATRETFEGLAAAGAVGPDTVVFDLTIPTVGDLRRGRWELPARDAWHGQAFFGSAGEHGDTTHRGSHRAR